MDVIKIEQQNIVLGRKSVKQALDDAAEVVNSILQGN
jgi:ABC-type glycerol-3-phosphate transport system substrate-binding protein